MAEIGLLPFARIALQVCRAVPPRYRSPFSKHQFNQLRLLVVLCSISYEDWTFREAEVRLDEHRELRQAPGLRNVPNFTTLYGFLQHLDDQTIDGAVVENVHRLCGWRRHGCKRARVAVDATGLAQGAVNTISARWMHHRGQKLLPWRIWIRSLCCRKSRDTDLGTTARPCQRSSKGFRANSHRTGTSGRRVRR